MSVQHHVPIPDVVWLALSKGDRLCPQYLCHSPHLPANAPAAKNLVEEYWSSRSIPEGVANLADMRAAGASMPAAVCETLHAALNVRGTELSERLPPVIQVRC